MKHTASCLKLKQQAEEYEKLWPNHCRVCNGTGVNTWYENQSPLGSGFCWLEQMAEPCMCTELARCPRCGKRWIGFFDYYWINIHYKLYNALKNREDKFFKTHTHFAVALRKPRRNNWKGWIVYRIYYYPRKFINAIEHLHSVDTWKQIENEEPCPHCGWTFNSPGAPVWECYCWEDWED